MKKILLATTALLVTAGGAAAQANLNLSGYARFGVQYIGDNPSGDRWLSSNRFRLQLDASTTTDGGITFGARQRFQVSNDAAGGQSTSTGSGARFFGSYEGLTIAFGNILGSVESAPLLYMNTASAGMGLSGNTFTELAPNTVSNNGVFGWTAFASVGGGARNAAEVIYNFGDFTVQAHITDDRSNAAAEVGDGIILAGERFGSRSWGARASGNFEGFTVSLAYERWSRGFRDGDNVLFAGVGYDFGDGDVALTYARTRYNNLLDPVNDTELTRISANKWVLKGGYNVMPDLYAYGFVGRENNSIGTSYGLGASYALGGGASVEAGYTRHRNAAGDGVNRFSGGIFFRF